MVAATIAELETSKIETIDGLIEHIVGQLSIKNPVFFNLGAGQRAIKDFRGVDLYGDPDVRADLFAHRWDFTPDDSVDMLFSSHLIEHVPDLNGFMDNCWLKLKDKGLLLVSAPWGNSVRAWQDPDHKRPIFRETYCYFNKQLRKNMGVEHYEGGGSPLSDFDVLQMWPVFNKRYAARVEANPALMDDYMEKFNAVDDLTVLMQARKGREIQEVVFE